MSPFKKVVSSFLGSPYVVLTRKHRRQTSWLAQLILLLYQIILYAYSNARLEIPTKVKFILKLLFNSKLSRLHTSKLKGDQRRNTFYLELYFSLESLIQDEYMSVREDWPFMYFCRLYPSLMCRPITTIYYQRIVHRIFQKLIP